jgi:segregation and condensation protein B
LEAWLTEVTGKDAKITEPTEEDKDSNDRKKMILMEAALYVAGRPLDLKTLGSVIKVRSRRAIRRIAKILMKMKVRRLAVNPLLTLGPLKTLSYIAYRQPVSQKQVAEVRGGHAYGHIKALRDMDLINCEKDGRTSMIRTTDYFADYFGLSHDLRAMKRQLRKVFSELLKKEQEQRQIRWE